MTACLANSNGYQSINSSINIFNLVSKLRLAKKASLQVRHCEKKIICRICSNTVFNTKRMKIENASPGKRMPFLLKLINSRGKSLIFSHLCLASAILYATRHVVNFRLGASWRGCTICEPARHARQMCEALRLA